HLDRIPLEVFHHIIKFIPFSKTLPLSALSQSLRARVKFCYEADLESLLRHFVEQPGAFRDKLRSTNSIITGSAALAFVDPSLTDWSSPHCVNDLDIFCLERYFIPMVIYLLTEEGYEPDPHCTQPNTHMGEYTCNPSISSTICLKKKTKYGDRLVDVVQCSDGVTSAFRPITCFHSTAVMNWLTADSITVTYPALTFSRKSIIHP
ncbi:hypothetical protein BD410DRAFT_702549, partial [Rickenella mellea]